MLTICITRSSSSSATRIAVVTSGRYRITIVVVDKAGNQSTLVKRLQIKKQPPAKTPAPGGRRGWGKEFRAGGFGGTRRPGLNLYLRKGSEDETAHVRGMTLAG